MRNLLLICLISFSFAAFGFSLGKQDYTKPHISITPNLKENYRVEKDETALFSGSICLVNSSSFHKNFWGRGNKNKNKTYCKSLDIEGKFKKHNLRFYFPDTNTEVTEAVSINKGENGIEFTFESEKINPTLSNQLTVIVEEGSKSYELLRHSQAKIQLYIDLLNSKLLKHADKKGIFWKEHYRKKIDRWLSVFEKLQKRIKDKLENNPNVFARLDWPVQVENKIAPPARYSTVVGGFKLFMEIPLGVAYKGEKTKIRTRVSNLIEDEDDSEYKEFGWSWFKDYRWKYWAEIYWNGNLVGSSDKHLLGAGVLSNLEYQTNELDPENENKFELKFFKGKDLPRNLSLFSQIAKQSWGGISYNLEVHSDDAHPHWTSSSQINEVQYFREYPIFNIQASDAFGRLRKKSIVVTANHMDFDGRGNSFDLLSRLDIQHGSNSFQSEFHGIENGSSEYTVSGNINPLDEGYYTVSAEMSDFSGKRATPNPLVRNFQIDRTNPILSVNQVDDQLTNERLFSLPISVLDDSPVEISILHNGIEIANYEDKEVYHTLALTEGKNTIEVRVVDAAGNEAKSFKLNQIELDTIPPELSEIRPKNDGILHYLSFNFSGKSNEPLSKVLIDNLNIGLTPGSQSFTHSSSKSNEGTFSSQILATDLAGNTTEVMIDYEIILKLIRIELVSLVPMGGEIRILGQEGAARPGLEIDVSGGFFNSQTIIAKENGSFEASLDYSNSYDISAEDPSLKLYEDYNLKYSADTTLSGIVKDVNDSPIPGVTVRIKSTGQTAVTNSNGVFSIAEPATGDQELTFDGTTVSQHYADGMRRFSRLVLNVSLGNLERNVLDKVIYMAPILLDGTETIVEDGQSVTVTSPHAPGVSIDIPADTAIFPAGVDSKISMMEIPADRTSVELLDFSKPENVYALEPSGLKFTEPVKVTLPNPNEFVVGTELVIMSKNSETGYWEPDGTATVTESGEIETKEGEGISHFSEIYASPYGLELKEYAPEHRPGIYNDKGGLTKTIELPSVKVMGKAFAPKLYYNSLWANPNVLITNSFSTPSTYVYKSYSKTKGSFFGSGKVKVKTEEWMKPEVLKSQFTSGSIQTPWLFFDVTNPPENSTASYKVDMSELETGSYPAEANYVLQFRYIAVQRTKVKTRNFFGGTKTKRKTTKIDKLLDEIYPPALRTNVLLQNKVDSNFGRGWKLGLTQKILNPGGARLILEEENGALTPYLLKNSVETLATNVPKNSIMYRTGDGGVYTATKGKIHNLQGGSLVQNQTIPNDPVTLGINLFRYMRKCSGLAECIQYDRPRLHDCWWGKWNASRAINPVSIIRDQGGVFYIIDEDGAMHTLQNNETSWFASSRGSHAYFSEKGSPTRSPWSRSEVAEICKEEVGVDCSSSTYSFHEIANSNSYDRPQSRCKADFGDRTQYGSNMPKSGYSASSLRGSKFNNPVQIEALDNGRFLVVDKGNNTVRLLNTDSNKVTIYAGNRQTQDVGGIGRAVSTPIYHPTAVAVDKFKNVYIASEKGYIRKVDPLGNMVFISGRPVSEGGVLKDSAENEQMAYSNPQGLAIDNKNGYLYVADTGNHRIVQIDLVEGYSNTLAGTGICSQNDIQDGKSALNVSICSPKHISVDENGNLVYLDSTNNRIRKVNLTEGADGPQRFEPENPNDNSSLKRLANGTFERKYRDGTTAIFNSLGELKTLVDRAGNYNSYEYEQGKLVKIVGPTEDETILSYSGNNLVSITDSANRVTYFQYDGSVLSQVSYPDGSSEKFNYNSAGMMTSMWNKRGGESRFEYSSLGKLSRVTGPDSKSISFESGLESTFAADNYNMGAKKEISSGLNEEDSDILKDAEGYETKLNKDETGTVTSVTDSKGRVSIFERDLYGRPTRIERFDGTYSEFSYNQYGDLIYKYDSSSEEEESYKYNEFGSLTEYIDPQNGKHLKVYSSSTGLPTKATDPNGNSSYNSYFSNGLIKTANNDLGEASHFTYDQRGNLSKKTSPENEIVEYIRDLAGNIIQKINSDGKSTYYTYDEFNRLTSVATGISSSDPVGKLTSYLYDQAGSLVKIIDPLNNETTFEYDFKGQLVKKTTPLGQVTELSYDGNGNVVWEKDANGITKTYEYDSDNLLKKKVLPDNVYVMSYDLDGNMTSLSNNQSDISFTYERIKDDYVVSSTTSEGVGLETTLEYRYDKLGNRVSMVTPFGDFGYDYDAGGRLVNLVNHKNQEFEFGYDKSNRLKSTEGPGTQSHFSYDNNGFMVAISHSTKSGVDFSTFVYERDLLGNKTKKISTRGVANYTYDIESQLTGVNDTEVGIGESFTYDFLGNRMNDLLGSYTYDSNSQRLTEDYKYLYLYDLNGNLTNKQERGMTGDFTNYTYSSENQLVKIEEFQSNSKIKTINYTYDALGRRIQKQVIDNVDSTKSFKRKYVYDGQEILSEFDETNSLLVVFTHSTLRTDDVLAADIRSNKLANQTGSYFYHKDSLGSITDITNANGTLIQHYAYSSFGKILKIVDNSGADITADPLVKTLYGFTNREHDSESGMMYFRARYYSPETGRFISVDPDPGRATTPITMINRYIYAGNNPLNYTDPTGKSFLGDLGKAIVVAAIIVAAVYTGGTVFAAVSGSVGSSVAGASVVTGAVGYGSTAAAIGSAVGAVAGFGAAVAAGATVGTVIGALGFGTVNALDGGSFDEGAAQGAQVGFVLGAISGGAGAASGVGFAEAPGSIGAFIGSNPYLFVTPSILLPITGEFNVEYECGVAKPSDFIFGSKPCR